MVGAYHTVDGDLQGQGRQQGQGALEQAEQEDAGNVGPVGPRLAQQAAIQGEIGVVHDHRSALLALLKGTPGSFRARTGCACVKLSGCVGLYTSSVRGEAWPSRVAR